MSELGEGGGRARNSFSTCRGLSGFCVTRSYSWAVFIMNMQLLFYYTEGGSPFSQVGAGLSVRNAVKKNHKCPFLVLRAIHYWENLPSPPFCPCVTLHVTKQDDPAPYSSSSSSSFFSWAREFAIYARSPSFPNSSSLSPPSFSWVRLSATFLLGKVARKGIARSSCLWEC